LQNLINLVGIPEIPAEEELSYFFMNSTISKEFDFSNEKRFSLVAIDGFTTQSVPLNIQSVFTPFFVPVIPFQSGETVVTNLLSV
jgi:hypothetical protein